MNFASITFLFYFLPIFTACYFCMPSRRAKNIALLIGSLLFYAWGEGVFLLVLIGSLAANHVFAGKIAGGEAKKTWLKIGIAANLLLLLAIKYSGFIGSQFTASEFKLLDHLPLGISFFTFQAMSLLVDVYRGQKPFKSVLDTGLYIAMFPQLIAGPIVRFNEVRGQIQDRQESVQASSDGIKLIILGLAQKVLIADTLTLPVEVAFSTPAGQLSMAAAWAGAVCFSFQIFYDFAGYSNIAIGLGRLFGFKLPQNFDYPYSARSFREFWRRWHMTLSRWFRDYLYIPLGGSKTGAGKTYRNLLIVFVLCGFWHGAAWTFLLWGLWHGAFLIAERVLPASVSKILHGPFVGPVYVFLGVTFGWVLFRASSAGYAAEYWKAMLGLNNDPAATLAGLQFLPFVTLALIAGALLSWDGWERGARAVLAKNPGRALPAVYLQWGLLAGLLALVLLSVAVNTHQPFIYFRF